MDSNMRSVKDSFDLSGRVIAITGGAGLLGVQHGAAVAEMGGIPVLLDLMGDRAEAAARDIAQRCGGEAAGLACDITRRGEVENALETILENGGASTDWSTTPPTTQGGGRAKPGLVRLNFPRSNGTRLPWA